MAASTRRGTVREVKHPQRGTVPVASRAEVARRKMEDDRQRLVRIIEDAEDETSAVSTKVLSRHADGLTELFARLRGLTDRAKEVADRVLGSQPEPGAEDGAEGPSNGTVDFLGHLTMGLHREASALDDELRRLEQL